jgi:hypothetical protein
MIWTAWNNGDHDPKGTGYGIKVARADRDRFFKPSWETINIDLPGAPGASLAVAFVNKASYWGPQCRELICIGLGKWLLGSKVAPWPRAKPPKFVAAAVTERTFRILGEYAPTRGITDRRDSGARHLPSAASVRCPFCATLLVEHKSSRCLDMWVQYALSGRPIITASEEDTPQEKSRGNVYYKHPERGLIPVPEYSTDMNLAWSIVVDARYYPHARRDHFLSTLSTMLRGMQPKLADWPALLLHIGAPAICLAAVAALATDATPMQSAADGTAA